MSEITKAIQHICDEKGLEVSVVMEALESALAAAYRKDFGNRQGNYKVKFSSETGDIQVWDIKEVVEDIEEEKLEEDQEELAKRREEARLEERELSEEEVDDLIRFNPKTQIMLKEAKEFKKSAKIGEILEMEQTVPGDFGRMAAQTAKQVVIQKLREAERMSVYDDFKNQEGQIVQGVVQRRDRSGSFIIDLGKITGILPVGEQVRGERYRPGERIRFFVVSVDMGTRGPEIVLSRTRNDMVQVVFEQEIPEIQTGEVVIKAIARDPGSRSKVAVWTDDDSIDPIGSCIGQRGSRITTIIDELGGEKIDVIQFNENAKEFIMNALSPAKVSSVDLDEKEKEAIVNVAEDQFSLAIGRGGQNVRLAAALTGWTIKVKQEDGEKEVSSEDDAKTIGETASEDKNDAKEMDEPKEEAKETKEDIKQESKEAKEELEEVKEDSTDEDKKEESEK